MKQSQAVQRLASRRVNQAKSVVPDGLGSLGPWIAVAALALGACADMGGEGEGRGPNINVPVTVDSGITGDGAVPIEMNADAGTSPPRAQCGERRIPACKFDMNVS